MFWNTLILAFREISRNLLRSFLTVLGVVIGVAAVITMVTLGNGATAAVSQQVASLGSNLIIVIPGQRMGMGARTAAPPFRVDDAEAIAEQITGVAAVAPTVSAPVTAVLGPRNWKTTAVGSTALYLVTGNWKIEKGRAFAEAEERGGKAVCLLGDTVRRELFGGGDPLGADLRLQGFSCQVIGTLAPKGQSSMGRDQDDIVLLPLRTVQRRLTGTEDIGNIMVSAADGASTDKVKDRIGALMRERRAISEGEDENFSILDTRQIAQTLSGTTKVMTMLLGAVAAVSLLVGGIGIMNIMLVSVVERTREIGIRLAIGAREREVLMQFLTESVVLSAAGGLAGILLAAGASWGLARLMDLPFLFDPRINLVSFAFSALIGVLFGFMPARRAARLNPIDALRHE